MTNKKLIEYIKSNLAKGHSLEEIRKFIVAYGWSQKEFDEAILEASGKAEKPPKPEKPGEAGVLEGEKKGKGHKKIILALIILVILIFVFLFVAAEIMNYFTGIYPESVLPFNISFPSFLG